MRHDGDMTPSTPRPGPPTALVTGASGGIGEEIEQLQRKKHRLNEIAILVRASFQMREFEDRFVTLGLPYRVIGGPRFYERAEIRDANAYLRLIAQADDDRSTFRVRHPDDGLGEALLVDTDGFAFEPLVLLRLSQSLTAFVDGEVE